MLNKTKGKARPLSALQKAALGLAAADEVWITETSTYSVISPEGCASILWKDSSKVAEASECLKLTAQISSPSVP